MTTQVNRVYRKMAVLLHPDKTEVNFLDPIVAEHMDFTFLVFLWFSYDAVSSNVVPCYVSHSFLIVFMQRLTERRKPSSNLARLGATSSKPSENRKHLETIDCCEVNACGNKSKDSLSLLRIIYLLCNVIKM